MDRFSVNFCPMELNHDEIQRYGRQVLLPEIGLDGQKKLKDARVLLVGVGGLGSPAAIYLTTMGVGTIGLIDADKVELSNLHRQVIHFSDDIGKPKVMSAKEKISQLNPHVRVMTYEARFNAENAMNIFKEFDLIIDGTDNFPARYLINDAALLSDKPFVFGGIFRFEGQCSVFGFKGGPCYRCFFEQPPYPGSVPSCAEAGVMGVLPGIIGLLQANEAVKIICGIGEPLSGRLLIFDGLAMRFREIKIKKNPACPMCGAHRTIDRLVEYTAPVCVAPVSSVDGAGKKSAEISVRELSRLFKQGRKDFFILDVRNQSEWQMARLPGAVLKPLNLLEKNYQDIPKDRTVYVHCQKGGRSQKAIEFLKTKGFNNLVNVRGGIDAWSLEVDPTVPRY